MLGQNIPYATESHTYTDENGKLYKETERQEELRTTGITGKRKYSENKIRKEHKRDQRVTYGSTRHDK